MIIELFDPRYIENAEKYVISWLKNSFTRKSDGVLLVWATIENKSLLDKSFIIVALISVILFAVALAALVVWAYINEPYTLQL